MTQYAYRRAAAIIIGAPVWRGKAIRSGSAFVIEQNGSHYLGTAWHVVAYWLKIRRRVKDLVFQVGEALLDPSQALVWKDEAADIAFLSLTAEQFAQIRIAVCEATKGWPAPFAALRAGFQRTDPISTPRFRLSSRSADPSRRLKDRLGHYARPEGTG